MSLEIVGKLVKAKIPGLAHLSDREVGLTYYNKKMRKPFPVFNRGGGLFTAVKIWLLNKESEYVQAQYEHHTQEENLEFTHYYAPLVRYQTEELRQVQHEVACEQASLTIAETHAAKEVQVDLPTWRQIQLKREEERLKLASQKEMAQLDVWKQQQANDEKLRFMEKVAKLEKKYGRQHGRVGGEDDSRQTAGGRAANAHPERGPGSETVHGAVAE